MGSRLAWVCRISTILYLWLMKSLTGTVLTALRQQRQNKLFPLYYCHFYELDPHTFIIKPRFKVYCPFFHCSNSARTHTQARAHIRAETQRSKEICQATFGIFFVGLWRKRFRHVTQDEANEWNVKILWKSKNKATQGLPFEEIIDARSGVEQIKQTALYTQQQPEQSCQMSSAEARTEWVLQMCVFNIVGLFIEPFSPSSVSYQMSANISTSAEMIR